MRDTSNAENDAGAANAAARPSAPALAIECDDGGEDAAASSLSSLQSSFERFRCVVPCCLYFSLAIRMA